jgi:glutamate N-acetyltransferase/amino-acid N-acetyltransferase
MSTGVIGQHVPIDSILSALSSFKHPDSSTLFSSSFTAWENAAKAFMTTDTFPKLRARTFQIGGETYRIAGMDKGAGMIHPNMRPAKTSAFSNAHGGGLHATLLACVLTDAPVSPKSLQSALSYAVDRSFNSISVDGEMSTNDTIIALANGAGALDSESQPEIDEETDKESYRVFRDELTAFTQDLAQLVVRDGEGATKFVKITVKVRFLPFFY